MQVQTSHSLKYEALQDKENPMDWRVEGLDMKSGDVYVTIFAGPLAETRAIEYAQFKNGHLAQKATATST